MTIKKFRLYFLLIFLIELISLASFLFAQNGAPLVREVAFFIILAVTLLLAVEKLEYGLLVLLAELFISSKGYLFFYEYEGFIISLRIALFSVVMSAWLGKMLLKWASTKSGFDINEEVDKYILKSKKVFKDFSDFKEFSEKAKQKFKKTTKAGGVLPYYKILFIFIVWGLLNGYWQHNSFDNLFFDFNGWLYFGVLFPVLYVARNNGEGAKQFWQELLIVFSAAAVWLAVKTLFLLYGFSHNLTAVVYEIYRWVRVTGVGEITMMENGFVRVFFQSHLYVIIGLFIFLSLLLYSRMIGKKNLLIYWFISLLGCICVTLISFSRSFWVGLAAGLLVYWFIILLALPKRSEGRLFFKKKWRAILWQFGVLAVAGALSVGLIFIIVRFPYPKPTADFSASMLANRAKTITGEAGVSSRWNLLPVLIEEIKKAPLQGRGFGATVTFVSQDPRVLEQNSTGEYTTYAFEWGWLDIWLKLGLFGLLAYAALLVKIFIDGFKKIQKSEIKNQKLIYIALLSGLVMLAVTSFFSPYLNHPLGIGYVVLVGVMMGL